MRADSFVHLHVHTEYSLLDGACRITELIARVKELGQTAVAVTDHGNMYAAVDFWREAKKAGIRPVIGCEVYVAPRTRFDREPTLDSKPYHLVLLCENNTGYRNLVKLVSAASLEGFYNKPRVDIQLLEEYHEGLICLSGCLAGEIPRLLVSGQYDEAKKKALRYREIFGEDNYFLEVQDHGIYGERRILPMLYQMSEETGIPLAATNDCHYINEEDHEMQNVLMCIQTNKMLGEPGSLSFETNEFYVKSSEQMAQLFAARPQAVTNTALIAERCNVDFTFGSINLPAFRTEESDDNEAFFRRLCEKGLRERYGENVPPEAVSRMEYEISVISGMGYTDYYLIVWDFIRYARENDIPVGPGRGSGAGSICAYLIGITGIDPLRYGLLFERFLNPERVSMPDFDIDFCIEGRQKVKEYVVRKYGREYVSEIIAFDTLKARAAVRDVGRVLGVPYQLCDKAAKLIDIKSTLSEALKESDELAQLYRSERSVRRMIDISLKLEGMPRHTSTHAAGVVISAIPLKELVPLQMNDDTVITQYNMGVLESLGLLKMDFLGLRNLTIIRDTVRQIRRTEPDFDISKIPVDDREVYEMMSSGDTEGVFQFESGGMTRVVMSLCPESIEDLISVISLYRPGPMKSIPVYIENKKHPEKIRYRHELLRSILSGTYGCMVYQEQVMEICRKLAGYSYGHADIVRRAMAKKKHDVMLKERDSFVSGAASNGIPQETANAIFDEMVSFASYAFNKSHAAAYAFLAYQTAYLKCHYRGVYMAALMSSVMGVTAKLSEYIASCQSSGIEVLRPDINRSMKGFTYEDGKMYFGLLAVKNAGSGLADCIIAERRKNGDFKGLQDFCERTDHRELNKKALENLIKAGAFDGLGLCRRQMLENYEMLLEVSAAGSKGVIEGQLDLFGGENSDEMNIKIPYLPEYPKRKLYAMEKEATGMYLTGDPLAESSYISQLMKCRSIASLQPDGGIRDGDSVRILCTVQEKKIHVTKKGDKMCFLSITDGTGEAEAVVFPEIYAVNAASLTEDSILYINGKVSFKENGASIVCSVLAPEKSFSRMASNMKLCIKTDRKQQESIGRLAEVCTRYPGDTQVCFYFTDVKKMAAPRRKMSVMINEASYRELTDIFPPEQIGLI